jgi:hypothetical protein
MGWVLVLILSGCGGGGGGSFSSSSSASSSSSSSSSSSAGPSLSQRTQAATNTAQSNAACTAVQPFYWEIGDRSAALASASVSGASTPVTAASIMLIASASKWLFGAYVVQLRQGQPLQSDIDALTMRSGYTHLDYSACIKLNATNQNAETVSQCLSNAHTLVNNDLNVDGFSNDSFEANYVGKFFYNGAHFQKLAVQLNLGADNNAALQTHIADQIGGDFSFSYDSPQLAAGVSTSAAQYAIFLRKILDDRLLISALLGTHAVCTNPSVCPAEAQSAPIPSTEAWHYSLGHWVEDDPTVGDGAFSSPGAFGFYPWIDAGKTYYGVLARYKTPTTLGDSVAADSVACGRLIRKAWLTGAPQ